MDVYRSPMEKILKQDENATIITNPKDPGKTFLRKLAYRYAYWVDRIKRVFRRPHEGDGQT